MLDRPVPLSRPRAPSRKSISNGLPQQSTFRQNRQSLDLANSVGHQVLNEVQMNGNGQDPQASSQPHSNLSESPLSNVVKILQDRLPNGSIDFNPCGSLADALSPHLNSDENMESSVTGSGPTQDLDNNPTDDQVRGEGDEEPSAISLEWISHQTREELESLLVAADRVIRERERDLGIAASIGKSLLENNIALRARQEKLLERVSSSPLTSGPSSPTAYRSRIDDINGRSEYIEARPPPSPLSSNPRFELGHSSHAPKFNLSGSSTQLHDEENLTPSGQKFYPAPVLRSAHSSLSSVSSTSIAIAPNHARRTPANASPAALQRLAQQNEYLAERLAELEAETADSEIQGRKRLRKLVKELESLKSELRRTEERNAVLEEERMNHSKPHRKSNLSGVGNMVEEIVGDMKRAILDDNDEFTGLIPSNGPINQIRTKPQRMNTPTSDSDVCCTPTKASGPVQNFTKLNASRPNSRSSSVSNLSISNELERTTNPAERALVSQLMIKISELKDSQVQFEEERELMKKRLRTAQEEVESMRSLVEEAEGELTQYRQLSWEDYQAPSLIGWDGAGGDDDAQGSLSQKAPGNQRMIEKKKTKYGKSNRKKHWPSVGRHNRTLESELTPEPESVKFMDYDGHYGQEPESPCLRGKPLSFTFSNRSMNEDEQEHQARVLRAVGAMSATPSIGSELGDDESLKGIKQPEIETLFLANDLDKFIGDDHDQDEGNLSRDVESLTDSLSAAGDTTSKETLSPNDTSSSIIPTPDRPYVSQHQLDLMEQQSYTELQRAVAELPVVWADEDEDNSRKDNLGRSDQVSRKRDSTGWLYDQAGDYNDFEAWSTSPKFPHRKLQMMAEDQFRSGRIGQKSGRIYGEEEEEERSSTVSSSATTIGKENSSSDSGTGTNSQTSQRRRKDAVLSRRDQALRRLGIQTVSSDSSNSSENRATQPTQSSYGEIEEAEEDEAEAGQEDEEGWNYIDSTDHDNKPQGSRGTDYYPISTIERNTPGMVVERVKVESSQMRVFFYQWAKLVTVVGFAVGWALWQGPKGMAEKSVGSEDDLNWGTSGKGSKDETGEKGSRRRLRERKENESD